jgi:hypothetical protein
MQVFEEYLEIFNLQGKLVFQLELNQPTSNIDLSAFAKGVYLFKIGQDTEKLVVY